MSGPQPYPPAYATPYPQSYPPYGAPYPPPRRGTNGFAIAGFVLSIFGFLLLSVIFGIIGLVQTTRRRQAGRGLAIASLVISGLWVLFIVVLAATGAFNGPVTVSATQVKVGECIQDKPTGAQVKSMDRISCDQPHWGEVYAVLTIPDGPYPGQTALDAYQNKCGPELAAYSSMATHNPAITTYVLQPTPDSWDKGDHTVTCIAETQDKRTASIKG